jgi:hypothetical protein
MPKSIFNFSRISTSTIRGSNNNSLKFVSYLKFHRLCVCNYSIRPNYKERYTKYDTNLIRLTFGISCIGIGIYIYNSTNKYQSDNQYNQNNKQNEKQINNTNENNNTPSNEQIDKIDQIDQINQINQIEHLTQTIIEHVKFTYSTLTLVRIGIFCIIDLLLVSIIGCTGLVYIAIGSPLINNSDTKLVVLIHGTSVNDWQWAVAKLYLYLFNIPCMTVNYNSKQPINESCDEVFNQIMSANNEKNNDIILIGHSQGGLIARKIHDQVNSKMTFLMNTPQKGAPILNWMYPNKSNQPCSRDDMKFDSEFIKSLPILKNFENIHEIVGLNDAISIEHCISYGKHVYFGWTGHYYSAVNPLLWLNYIIPAIKNYDNKIDN